MEAQNKEPEVELLAQCKLMTSPRFKIFGLMRALTIISAVIAGILLGLTVFSDKSLPAGAGWVMLISGICFVVFLIIASLVKAKEDIELIMDSDANQDLIIWVNEKEVILNPDHIEYYYYIELSGRKMNLKLKHLVLCLYKNKKCHLVLQESYGAGISAPASWAEITIDDHEKRLKNGGAALQKSYFHVMDINEKKLEQIVEILEELPAKNS